MSIRNSVSDFNQITTKNNEKVTINPCHCLFNDCFCISKPDVVKATLHADQPGAKINREIYGQFSEHLGSCIYGGLWVGKNSPIPNINGYRKDVFEALKKLQVPVLRW